MTNAEIAAGELALKTYATGVTWEAVFAPAQAWRDGAIDIIRAADDGSDQSPPGRQASAQVALRKALDATGYGNRMNAQQCHDATAVVLAAAHKVRGK